MSTTASGIMGGASYAGGVVAASRTLTPRDNGAILECTVAGLTLTVPADLPPIFGCTVIPNGTTSVAATGVTLNGAGTTVTRAASANAVFAIVQRPSAVNSYVVTGS